MAAALGNKAPLLDIWSDWDHTDAQGQKTPLLTDRTLFPPQIPDVKNLCLHLHVLKMKTREISGYNSLPIIQASLQLFPYNRLENAFLALQRTEWTAILPPGLPFSYSLTHQPLDFGEYLKCIEYFLNAKYH